MDKELTFHLKVHFDEDGSISIPSVEVKDESPQNESPKELKLEVGKFYKNRLGHKYKVIHIGNNNTHSPINRVVTVYIHDDSIHYCAINGSLLGDEENLRDLIQECEEGA